MTANFAIVGATSVASATAAIYTATQAFLYANPKIVYEASNFFTGYFSPGPPEGNLGSLAGGFLNNADKMNAAFDAFLDFATDPDSPVQSFQDQIIDSY